MLFPIGTEIGDLTVAEFDVKDTKGTYKLLCKCGAKSSGGATTIKRAIAQQKKHGYIGCQKCKWEYLASKRINSDLRYNSIYVRYKKGAKDRKIYFDLTIPQALELFTSACTYCGKKETDTCVTTKYDSYCYMGIDRLDPSIGYTLDNVVPSCQNCNVAKYMFTPDKFFAHISRIYSMHAQRLSRKGVEPSGSKWEASLDRHLTKEEDIV